MLVLVYNELITEFFLEFETVGSNDYRFRVELLIKLEWIGTFGGVNL